MDAKVKIELNFAGDAVFLNFWNWYNGKDVVCELIDGKLMLSQYNEDASGELIHSTKEITFNDFVELVKERAQEIDESIGKK